MREKLVSPKPGTKITAVVALVAVFQGSPSTPLKESAKVSIEVDGKVLKDMVAPPRLVDGHTYVRVCTVSDALHVKTLNYKFESVWIDRGEEHWVFPVAGGFIMIGDVSEPAPLSPTKFGDNLWFPLRFVAERLGYQVAWDPHRRTVVIKTGLAPSGSLPPPKG